MNLLLSTSLKCSRHIRPSLRCSATRYLQTTINKDEINHFSKLSSHWWDEKGEFGLLHRMNPVRVQYILEKLQEVEEAENTVSSSSKYLNGRALSGLDVVDVGCGGGLLSEALARLGANTLAIDASESNITIASLHASKDPLLTGPNAKLEYRHTSSEELIKESRRFDVVCSMEVLEHVDNPALFLHSCCDLLKPGGHLFMSTVARTPLSYFLTIFMAEQVLRKVTPGTHHYDKFVNSEELVNFFHEEMGWFTGVPGRLQAESRGIIYLPWKDEWILAGRNDPFTTECNYMFWARKPL
ncbi:hypothetical protein Clacol_009410 [Clathrus columnatus]|uniref:Ubiquinone biosynthesis O-methyltransferase, mitochondrial n=1 Tax=Clathrus columnatus TaxID=1419009 RepID=A0AAV5AL34_9AGAM|nr:hypothetical protein Clacol_009410 [Clathrus columnatus]